MVGLEEHAERHPRLTDALIVLAVLGGAVIGVYFVGPGEGRPQHLRAGEVVTGIACLSLFKARERPRSTVVVTTVCAVAAGALGLVLSPLLLAPLMVALYRLAAMTDYRTTWAYGSVTTPLVVTAAVGVHLDETVALRALGPALWLLLPLAMGSRTRLRHAWLDAVQARAEHAERNREEEAQLRVMEERMRIARDLHDVVAHHMAVANAQAGTAAHLLESDPALTKKILTDLQATTSSVMLELRNTVGVLRQNHPEADGLEPAPGLAQLPDLLDVCRSAGLAVNLEIEGRPQGLAAGVDLTAYRIIQEALTNATKHSASAAVTLRLCCSGTRLTITAINDRRADDDPRQASHGYGIIGMRERAHAVGGDLRVSDSSEACFRLVAVLPLPPRTSAPSPAARQETP
ncbi:MAG: hypothetical protein QG608_2400 [Actinomycetota bacterium]|nr:hypothetical protein [Actinomycetota bacterium]